VGRATILAPDFGEAVAPQEQNHEVSFGSKESDSRKDVKAIARAAILHLNGNTAEALRALQETAPKPESTEMALALGYIQCELGNYTSAAEAYQELVEKEPDAAEAWFQWGFCLYKLGRPANALERFEKAASLRPDWIEIPLARAICHLSLKQHAEAFDRVGQCLGINPSYLPALFTKAVTFHVTWELEHAAELYRRVLELDPTSAEALMNLITLGLQKKQYTEVRSYSEKLAALQPDNPLGIEGLAAAAFHSEDYETASRHYARLTELAPGQVSHWLNLGVSKEKRGMLTEAAEAFRKARDVRDDSVHAHTYLGAALWKAGDLEDARACYERALSKWPEKEDLVLGLAQVLEELGSLDQAATVCAQYCDTYPGHKLVWFRLGYLQYQLDRAEAAIEGFTQALKIAPVWAEADLNLALACYRAGEMDRAESVLNALLTREPANLDALKTLAMVTLAQGRNERSLELHEKLLKQGGPDADVSYNCGVLAQRLDELPRAEKFYRDAIATRQSFAEALLNLGHVLDKLGRASEAREVWIPALELRPELSLGYFRRT